MTVVGFLDTRTVSSSAAFTSFLLSMCAEAPEFTTSVLSSGFVQDGTGTRQTSEGEKSVALSISLSLRILFAISPACLRRIVLVSRFLLHTCPPISEHGELRC